MFKRIFQAIRKAFDNPAAMEAAYKAMTMEIEPGERW